MLNSKKLMMFLLAISGSALGEMVTVPNFSFELPPVTRDEKNPFGALPFIDDWDETEVGLGDELNQNTGVFLNTEPSEPDHITNPHLDRLAFISSLIEPVVNAVRQELTQTFEPGRSYSLTVAVGTSFTFGVGADEELEIALFYFNGGVEQVIASSFIAGSEVNATLLIDVNVSIPPVEVSDAWANQPIGVLIRPSITDSDDSEDEGFWNADYVRLEASDVQVPAVSTWGLALTMMMLCTAGTIVLRLRAKGKATS